MKKTLFVLLVILTVIPAFAMDTNASGNNTSDYIQFDTDTDIDIFSIEPVYSLTFVYETEEVAWLDFEGNKITFRGDNIQAARILIDYHYYWGPSDNNDYRLYLGNENNFIVTIIFTPDDIEYDGNFTVSSEADQFFNAVLSELQKREKFK